MKPSYRPQVLAHAASLFAIGARALLLGHDRVGRLFFLGQHGLPFHVLSALGLPTGRQVASYVT